MFTSCGILLHGIPACGLQHASFAGGWDGPKTNKLASCTGPSRIACFALFDLWTYVYLYVSTFSLDLYLFICPSIRICPYFNLFPPHMTKILPQLILSYLSYLTLSCFSSIISPNWPCNLSIYLSIHPAIHPPSHLCLSLSLPISIDGQVRPQFSRVPLTLKSTLFSCAVTCTSACALMCALVRSFWVSSILLK